MDDHLEVDLGTAALVSDRGHRHQRNEDAGELLMTDDGVAAVVCDGVSTTANPDQASAAAAKAAVEVLVEALGTDPDEGPDILRRAVLAARRAVEDVPTTEPGGYTRAPSTTLVLAAVLPGLVLVTGVGDSRVYWVGDAGRNVRLTVDDSWAEAAIAAGVPEADAYQAPQAHVITNWIGGEASDDDPSVSSVLVEQEGLLIICSDGLWNYLPDADDLAAAVAAVSAGPSDAAGSADSSEDAFDGPRALAVARHLVGVALDAGGSDNITVAVIEAGPVPLDPTVSMDGDSEDA